MTLILAIIPVLLLIILMAFFKMPGDKSSIISLVVTMLIALFGFTFSVDNLFYSFLYGALKAVSPILIIILMAIFSYNVLLKTEKMETIKQQCGYRFRSYRNAGARTGKGDESGCSEP